MSKFGENIFTQFDGTNPPEDFNFPSIEIEDIDRAVFDLFASLREPAWLADTFGVLQLAPNAKTP